MTFGELDNFTPFKFVKDKKDNETCLKANFYVKIESLKLYPVNTLDVDNSSGVTTLSISKDDEEVIIYHPKDNEYGERYKKFIESHK